MVAPTAGESAGQSGLGETRRPVFDRRPGARVPMLVLNAGFMIRESGVTQHGGFDLLDLPGHEVVEVACCPNGVELEVLHQPDGTGVVVRSVDGRTWQVSWAAWRAAVFGFVDRVAAFYTACPPKEVEGDVAAGFTKFMAEWERRRGTPPVRHRPHYAVSPSRCRRPRCSARAGPRRRRRSREVACPGVDPVVVGGGRLPAMTVARTVDTGRSRGSCGMRGRGSRVARSREGGRWGVVDVDRSARVGGSHCLAASG